MHFLDYIAPTNELSLDVDLRNCGPIGEFLNALSHVLIGKHVHIFVVFHTVEFKHLSNIVTETASWHLLSALHEHNNIVLLDPFSELVVQLHFIKGCLLLGLKVIVTFLMIVVVVMIM